MVWFSSQPHPLPTKSARILFSGPNSTLVCTARVTIIQQRSMITPNDRLLLLRNKRKEMERMVQFSTSPLPTKSARTLFSGPNSTLVCTARVTIQQQRSMITPNDLLL